MTAYPMTIVFLFRRLMAVFSACRVQSKKTGSGHYRLFWLILALTVGFPGISLSQAPQDAIEFAGLKRETPPTLPGQTATLLPDGRWLLLGGEKDDVAQNLATLVDPATGQSSPLLLPLTQARAWHTATVLPNGRVLILGGIGEDGLIVGEAEVFDGADFTFNALPELDLTPRIHHTATLLTDGRVLIIGGLSDGNWPIDTAETWDVVSGSVEKLDAELLPARYAHQAALVPNENVLLWGGYDTKDQAISHADLYLPSAKGFKTLDKQNTDLLPAYPYKTATPAVMDSVPRTDAVDVPIDALITVRFNKPLQPKTLNPDTVTLFGPFGPVVSQVTAAEEGLLLFVSPKAEMLPATHYTLFIRGAKDDADLALPFTALDFETEALAPVHDAKPNAGAAPRSAGQANASAKAAKSQSDSANGPAQAQAQQGAGSAELIDEANDESWTPGPENFHGDWRSGRGTSHFQNLPPLQAPPGVTALAGQVLRMNGNPLADVTFSVGGKTARSDRNGQFLLSDIPAGRQVLIIDGHSANHHKKTYGVFEVKVEPEAGKTQALDYTIWMPVLDTRHAVSMASPTTDEVVVATPDIPGLELHIPSGTVIRDRAGNVVTEVGITAIPVDQPPFPLPPSAVPVYFTIQPGGAYLQTVNAQSAKGARVIYPNFTQDAPGTVMEFWNYDPVEKGWYVYGQGRVSEDGKQVIPDPDVAIYEFSGAMVTVPGMSPPGNAPPPGAQTGLPGLAGKGGGNGKNGRPPCNGGKGGGPCGEPAKGGEPVDLATGLFAYEKTDLMIADTLPLMVSRTYRNGDTATRAFGIGTNFDYGIFMWSAHQYQEADLVMPDGAKIHFVRTSAGAGWTDAVFECTASSTAFYQSKMVWNGNGWDLTLKDGTVYVFGENRPLQAIRDRYGNTVTLIRSSGGQSGNITRIVSTNGRWIEFSYDARNRITQAADNIGRSVGYTYDSSGRLWKVTDPAGGVTEYTYDTSHRLLTAKDPKGIVYLTNVYDDNGRVIEQTLADSGTYQFDYTLDGNGKVAQTDVTDPLGVVRRVTFNDAGYPLTDTWAQGKTEQQTWSYTRDATTNRLVSSTDPLGRVTAYEYDTSGNVTKVTRLSGTAEAVATSYSYEPQYHQLASVTDPLSHSAQFSYDSRGNLITATDPTGQQSHFTYLYDGHLATATDPLGNVTQFDYDGGDLVAVTDPLGNQATRYTDSLGRVIVADDALGNRSWIAYDAMGRVAQTTDPLGRVTQFGYDANGNLTSVTDARSGVTAYGYDDKDRRITRTDPLGKIESFSYDLNDNLTGYTDRLGQVSEYGYDALNRRILAGYGASSGSSSNSNPYLDGLLNQLKPADSGGGYASQVTYTYDAGNRLTQAVDSQSGTITRSYDNLNRLTGETTPQGSVSYAYDDAGRRTELTVAGQAVVSYGYDAADRLTSITQGSDLVGYAYDDNGRRSSLTLPNGITVDYGYDEANRLLSLTYRNGATVLGDLSYAYDAVGRRIATGGSYAATGLPAALSSASYDANNRLTVRAGTTLSYDDNGSLTADGSYTYTWDERNRLSQISQGGSTIASFAYDPFGRRIAKTAGGATRKYLYDGLNLAQELNGSTPTANYLAGPGIDEVHRRTDANGARYFLSDALGSTLALTDSAGTEKTRYTYDPFGKTTVSGQGSANPIQYTGRENDGTGLYYYRARYYHPGLQRFIAEDPIGLAGGINGYAYVENNPVNLIDPEGLASSGQTTNLGGGTTVRIDNPHVPGQQEHAHVQTPKGEAVVNQDGSQSHKGKGNLDNLNKKAKDFLRGKGFKIPGFPLLIDPCLIDPGAPFCSPQNPNCPDS